jgi:hypothetical protein
LSLDASIADTYPQLGHVLKLQDKIAEVPGSLICAFASGWSETWDDRYPGLPCHRKLGVQRSDLGPGDRAALVGSSHSRWIFSRPARPASIAVSTSNSWASAA